MLNVKLLDAIILKRCTAVAIFHTTYHIIYLCHLTVIKYFLRVYN